MEEIKILFDSLLYAIYISPIIFFLSFVIYLIFEKYFKYKKNVLEENKIDYDNETDIFGLNQLKDEKKFKEDLEEIRKSISNGGEQIKVDFTKAMYILKNFNDYNFLSSEDNKIIFEKLKTIIDNETQIESEMIDSNMTEKISIDEKPFNQTSEILEDGSIKVYNPNGYTIIKDNIIIDRKNYEVEEKKKVEEGKNKSNINNSKVEEIEQKINSMEEKLLHSDDKKSKTKKKNIDKKHIIEDVNQNEIISVVEHSVEDDEKYLKNDMNFDSKSMNDDIEKLIGNFVDIKNENDTTQIINENIEEHTQEKNVVKIVDEKYENIFLKELKTEFDLLEDYSIVFILETFDEMFIERIDELISWLFNPMSLLDKENKFIFCDIDLENKTLFIDANLFVYLFSKYYRDFDKFLRVLLHSGEILNSESLKKILNKINLLVSSKYNKELFKFIGRSKSPFTERIVTYEIDGTKRIVSTQMLMIDISIEEDEFDKYLEIIKDVIVSIDRPKLYKASKNKKEIDSFAFEYFKKISLN